MPLPFSSNVFSFLGRLCGSYEDLQHGQVSDALLDFTGGVTVTIQLAEAPGNLWDILTRATYGRTFIGCQTHLGVRPGWVLAGSTRCCSHLGVSPKTSAHPCAYSPTVQPEQLRAGKAPQRTDSVKRRELTVKG